MKEHPAGQAHPLATNRLEKIQSAYMFSPILISHCMHHGSSIEEESGHKLSQHPESNNHKQSTTCFTQQVRV